MAKGNTADSKATVCRRPLDPERKALRDLMRNAYTTARQADNVRCPCGERLADCAKAVYHA